MSVQQNPDSSPESEQKAGHTQRRRTLDDWQSLVSQQIDEAMRRGDFDNLPGKGKPLNLNQDPNEPDEMRMANRLLKNNDLAPAWMLDRQSLLTESDQLRAEIARQWQWFLENYAGESDDGKRAILATEWASLVRRWEETVTDLNRRILNLNLTLPVWRMELGRLNLDRELDRVGARRRLTLG